MWTTLLALCSVLSGKPRRKARTGRRPPLHRPLLEGLEDRCLLSWSITNLGTLGGPTSEAGDINASGQVVGTSTLAQGGWHGFLWQNGVMTDLGTLGGYSSEASAINDFGQVVGESYTAKPTGPLHAFLWEDGVMTDLGTLGGTDSKASDINNAGQVVGTSSTGSADHAFLWQGGEMTDLGTLGGPTSSAVAINDAGQVLGSSTTAAGVSHTFLWQGGVMTDLGQDFSAKDINNAGQWVGSLPGAWPVTGHAALWTPTVPNGTTGSFTDLGTLPQIDPFNTPESSVACGINNAGQVVGYSREDVYAGDDYGYYPIIRPFVWANGVMQQLPGLSADGATARAINGAGQIVGTGDLSAAYRALLFTPTPSAPAPALAVSASPSPTPLGTPGTFTAGAGLAGSFAAAARDAPGEDSRYDGPIDTMQQNLRCAP